MTGAPIEHLPYEDVNYWEELCELFDWAEKSVHSLFGICWGGMAMLYYWYGIEKHLLNQKAFGCFPLENLAPSSPYLRGFSDECVIPISRWTEVRDIEIGPVPRIAHTSRLERNRDLASSRTEVAERWRSSTTSSTIARLWRTNISAIFAKAFRFKCP